MYRFLIIILNHKVCDMLLKVVILTKYNLLTKYKYIST